MATQKQNEEQRTLYATHYMEAAATQKTGKAMSTGARKLSEFYEEVRLELIRPSDIVDHRIATLDQSTEDGTPQRGSQKQIEYGRSVLKLKQSILDDSNGSDKQHRAYVQTQNTAATTEAVSLSHLQSKKQQAGSLASKKSMQNIHSKHLNHDLISERQISGNNCILHNRIKTLVKASPSHDVSMKQEFHDQWDHAQKKNPLNKALHANQVKDSVIQELLHKGEDHDFFYHQIEDAMRNAASVEGQLQAIEHAGKTVEVMGKAAKFSGQISRKIDTMSKDDGTGRQYFKQEFKHTKAKVKWKATTKGAGALKARVQEFKFVQKIKKVIKDNISMLIKKQLPIYPACACFRFH